ncbi:MAG: transcription elongation factor GreA [candidate division Zixibacteria bacterium]|nr:transcription elongation factor GreA [candidate division Zixibacteria bacterium]
MTSSSGFVYLTPDGQKKMQAELKRLKTVERPKVVSEISSARDHGDLSENAEYHAAKERQVLVERQIAELEDKLSRARTIDEGQVDSDKAYLLSFVSVKDANTGEEIRYQIVSPEEADFDEDRISLHSPIGKGLLGKSKGDRVTIQVPAGELTYDIVNIERPE